jgi:hypothetical protein
MPMMEQPHFFVMGMMEGAFLVFVPAMNSHHLGVRPDAHPFFGVALRHVAVGFAMPHVHVAFGVLVVVPFQHRLHAFGLATATAGLATLMAILAPAFLAALFPARFGRLLATAFLARLFLTLLAGPFLGITPLGRAHHSIGHRFYPSLVAGVATIGGSGLAAAVMPSCHRLGADRVTANFGVLGMRRRLNACGANRLIDWNTKLAVELSLLPPWMEILLGNIPVRPRHRWPPCCVLNCQGWHRILSAAAAGRLSQVGTPH